MKSNTIEQLEKETGLFLTVDHDPNKTMDRIDFVTWARNTGALGVAYEDRVEFLENNDYEVTRENIIDTTLHARQVD